jgi:hypothetical protein
MEDFDYDYETVTIYNWKDGHVPLNECSWHVGGKSYMASEIAQLQWYGTSSDYNYEKAIELNQIKLEMCNQ